ncbi:MAG: benzoate-CoA ligase family protein [Nevskiaceae bacterium]|nr:MAG: benzoate-CoA ligase family protein [Nevskiaceae bacterium]TBR73463.1 MAG: benzoate-CoA ligase family protein [Nevskiaceae bacterium]
MPVLTPPPHAFNFAAYLFQLNAARADKTAYIDDHGTLTYGALEDESRRFGAALLNAGIHPEERVLLAMPDRREWPVAYLGALYAGVVPVCVNTLLPAEDYAFMLGHSRARAIITAPELQPVLRAAAKQAAATPLFVVADAADGPATPFAAFIDTEPLPAPAATCADDIAFWLYSSGSTGQPKGVVHTHANPYWTIQTYGRNVLKLEASDVVFSAAKAFFAYGLGNAVSFPLAAGATTVLMAGRPTPQAVYERLTRHHVTVFYGVPTLFASMLAVADLPPRGTLALRRCTSAGEPLSKSLGERFTAHFGVEILDGIGSTEMLHIFLCNRSGDVHYGTTGTPVPGYEISLRDEHGAAVAPGEIGDLYIKGESTALMYWADRARSRNTFIGPWLKAGDKYQVDENGYYRYCGRSDDMLKVSGQYVSPAEVEACLIAHPDVLEAAVIGVKNTNGLLKTKAFVVLKDHARGSDQLAATLHEYVKGQLAPHKAPKHIEFLAELPKTATGKIQRFRLREREAAKA